MNDGRKVILGQLIDFYREELEEKCGSELWGIDQFIYNTSRQNSESICSRTTYYKMKSKEPIKTQTYHDLINKLGYQYQYFDSVEEYIPDIMRKLYQAVFYLDKNKLQELQVRIDKLFSEAKEYFYYRDIYKVLCFIIELHSDELHSFNTLTIDHIGKVSSLLDCIDSNILIYSWVTYEINYSMDLKRLSTIYSKLPSYKECEDPLVMFCIIYKHNNSSEVELAQHAIRRIEKMIPEDNYNFLMRIRLRKLYYIYYYHSSMADIEYQETYKYIQEHPYISTRMQKNFHYNYAMYLFANSRIEEAIEVFDRFFKVDDSFDIYAESISAMCHLKINKKITRVHDLESLDYTNLYACILEYCVLKDKGSDIGTLSTIVEKKIIPKCAERLPDDVLSFLRQEIIWITTQSKRYKLAIVLENMLSKKANKN